MKNRRTRVVLVILLLVIIALAVTACGSSTLVGRWQNTEYEEAHIEFFSDGQMEMGNESIVYSGTYEETGDKEVTLTLTGVNGEAADENEQITLEYSFSGNELTLTDGVNPATFTRVK